MVEMNREISGHDYPLYHGGEEQGKAGTHGQNVRSFEGSLVWATSLLGLSFSSLGLFPTHHSSGEDDGMGPVSYPQRPGEVECQYYMKTGTCK